MTLENASLSGIPRLFARLCPESLQSLKQEKPFLYRGFVLFVLLLGFLATEFLLSFGGGPGAQVYSQPSLLVAVWKEYTLPLIGGGIFLGVLLLFGNLGCRWSELDAGNELRYFVLFIAAILCWFIITLGYNHYFNQSYIVEYVLLVVLLALIWFRPVFVIPYLLLAYPTMLQIAEPALGSGSDLPHKLHLMRALDLFAVWLVFRAITGRASLANYIVLLCCLVASVYWMPAWTKWSINWLSYGHIYRMLPAAHTHGWLGTLDTQTILQMTQWIKLFDKPMQLFVLAAESAFIFVLWRRKFTMVLMVALSLFHLGVFLMYGFFFWTWILLNFATLVLLWQTRKLEDQPVFGGKELVLTGLPRTGLEIR